MAARPRDRRRRDWPTGMREPRPGYFTWRHPETGAELAIGRVTLVDAKAQCMQANEYLIAKKPNLLERLTGAGNTVAMLMGEMPVSAVPNTAKSNRSLDKKIKAAVGNIMCAGLTVTHCAKIVEDEIKAGRARQALALRTRLLAICQRGMQLGWMEANVAEPTGKPKVTTKRGRLSLEMFLAVREKAPEVNEWLAGAMNVALVSGMDRDTLASLERTAVGQEVLTLNRGKTGVWIEIPLRLRLDALGMTLAEALASCRSRAISKFVVHHAKGWGNAPVGTGVHPDRITHAFAEARALAGIDGEDPPTWHEIRSLSKRLYDKQGGVDTKALLGHLTDKMSELYADSRGTEAIRVKVG